MTEAERIAAGLTLVQRRAVLTATYASGDGVWHAEGWYCRADRRVSYNLSRAGVVYDYLRRSNRLTPLGLDVRAVLERSEQGEGK